MNILMVTHKGRTSLKQVPHDSDRLSAKEVCTLLGISPATFYRRKLAGLIPEPTERKPDRWARGQFKFGG